MNLDVLRVYNVVNNLGISEVEFDSIAKELECKDYTGWAVVKATPKFLITINHDNKHTIEIVPNTHKLSSVGRVLFKTFFTFDVPMEVFVLHDLARYRSNDNDPKYTATNLDGLKDNIMERICDKKYVEVGHIFMSDTEYRYRYDEEVKVTLDAKRRVEVKKELQAIYWLFGESFDKDVNNRLARPNIPMIVKVFQRKNRRLAIIQYDKDYDEQRGNAMFGGRWIEHIEAREIRINVYKPTMSAYNYVCEGRELLWDYNDNELWLDDDMLGKIPYSELRLMMDEQHSSSHQFVLLNSKDYGRIQKTIRIKLLEESRSKHHRDAQNKVRDNVDKEYMKGKITRHGILFTHKTIEYKGVILESDDIKEYVINQRIHLNGEPEFTQIFEGYVDWLLKASNYKSCSEKTNCYYSEFVGDPKSIIINGVKAVTSKTHNFLFVNGYKISKYDILVVVKNAINHNTQEDYDKYVSSVSLTNLKVQQAVSEGYIAFDIHCDNGPTDNFMMKTKDSIRISIPLYREKNKNYTIINDVKYPISNTEALFDIDEKPKNYYQHGELNRSIKLLYKAIRGITPKVIGELLADGKKAYKKHYVKIQAEKIAKIKRSKEFLAHAIKLTKAVKVKGGYKVKGLSGAVYTINSESLAVYNGSKYLCIVDMGDYELDIDQDALRNDRIAKRMLALSKDAVVAKEIYERGDHVDNYWTEVKDETSENILGTESFE